MIGLVGSPARLAGDLSPMHLLDMATLHKAIVLGT